jgi:cbb3-type cytochrome oxidase maturation protein
MESLYLLIPLSVLIVILIGWVFWRALHSGQFDDLDRPGYDILMDNDDTSLPAPVKSEHEVLAAAQKPFDLGQDEAKSPR